MSSARATSVVVSSLPLNRALATKVDADLDQLKSGQATNVVTSSPQPTPDVPNTPRTTPAPEETPKIITESAVAEVLVETIVAGPIQPLHVPAAPDTTPAHVEFTVETPAVRSVANPPSDQATQVVEAQTARVNSPAVAVPPLTLTSPGHGNPAFATESAAAAADRTGLSASLRVDTLVSASGIRLDTQGRLPVTAERETENPGAIRTPLPSGNLHAAIQSVAALPLPALTGEEPAEVVAALPLAGVAGLLTALPTSNLQAIESGMQRFLEQLDQLGQTLAASRDSAGLGVWFVAGAAAAVACEIARRQLKRPVVLPVLVQRHPTGSRIDPFDLEPS
jgi:hypothetical protein